MKDDMVALQGAALSILGIGTEDEFFEACRSEQEANGLLNRMLTIQQVEMPIDNDNPSTEGFPLGLLQNLLKLHNGPPGKLEWDVGAEELYRERKRALREETDERKRKLFVRGPELLIRLGSVIAASRFVPREVGSEFCTGR